MQNSRKCTCIVYRYDYLKVSNDREDEFGEYCGTKSGTEVFVTGSFAQLTFHSDFTVQKRGFNISFTFVGK